MTRDEFGIAYERMRDRTIRFLLSRGVPRDVAPDIAQSAWMRGWQQLADLRDVATLGTWINSIALNLYRKVVGRERRMVCGCSWENEVSAGGSGAANLEAAIDVSRVLRGCTQESRKLLVAQLFGTTPEELASEQGVLRVTMRVRLLRARREARTLLQPKSQRRRLPAPQFVAGCSIAQ
jgi:DNA-directed RNA polymerase specialized sigma24 family protein